MEHPGRAVAGVVLVGLSGLGVVAHKDGYFNVGKKNAIPAVAGHTTRNLGLLSLELDIDNHKVDAAKKSGSAEISSAVKDVRTAIRNRMGGSPATSPTAVQDVANNARPLSVASVQDVKKAVVALQGAGDTMCPRDDAEEQQYRVTGQNGAILCLDGTTAQALDTADGHHAVEVNAYVKVSSGMPVDTFAQFNPKAPTSECITQRQAIERFGEFALGKAGITGTSVVVAFNSGTIFDTSAHATCDNPFTQLKQNGNSKPS